MILTRVGRSHRNSLKSGRKAARLSYFAKGSEDHYIVLIVKKPAYKNTLEMLSALRNFAAHDSKPSKKRALQVIGGQKLLSSGAWLKKQKRFRMILISLKKLADDVQQGSVANLT